MSILLGRLRSFLAYVLLFGLALALRLYHLDAQSLWLDEGGSWAEVTGRTGKGWTVLIGELFSADAGYPLYHLLLKAWVSVAGDSEWALRFPSALAGALAVVVLALGISLLYASREATKLKNTQKGRSGTLDVDLKWPFYSKPGVGPGLRVQGLSHNCSSFNIQHSTFNIVLLGLLASVSPFLLWHAQDAKAYSLLLLVVSLLFLLTLRALKDGGRAWLWALLLALVSVFVHRLALLAVAGAALGALMETWEQESRRAGEPETADMRQQTRDSRHETADTRQGRLMGSREAGEQGSRRAGEQGDERVGERVSRGAGEQGNRGTGEQGNLPFSGFRLLLLGITVLSAVGGLWGTLRAAGAERAFISRGTVEPLESLWLTLVRFWVDRWPGDLQGFLGLPLWLWVLPFALLAVWALVLLVRDAWLRRTGAAFVLCVLLLPLALVMLLTAFSPIYEARYTIVAFPGWMMLVGYPGVRGQVPKRTGEQASRGAGEQANRRTGEQALNPHPQSQNKSIFSSLSRLYSALLVLAIGVSVVTLFQPKKGLFSGDPLKEQWREAVQYMAQHAQPDDLLLIHPSYVALMYDYYAPRVTPDRLQKPVTFPIFAQGDLCGMTNPSQKQVYECWVRRYDPSFNQAALGKKRALLLIAPDHARTVDPPKTLEMLRQEAINAGKPLPTQGDRYGGLGLRFEYPQDTWPCGGTDDALIGVEVMCQSYPDSFNAAGPGRVPEPDTVLEANFGNELHLRGFSIRPFGGTLKPGGALPITLYWSALIKPTQNYRMFLHLCQDCSVPPLANNDGPPLQGMFPAGESSSWQPNDPVHDERSLVLPKNLAPGRYTVLLGVYAGDGPRLEITDTTWRILDAQRLVLAEVEVGR